MRTDDHQQDVSDGLRMLASGFSARGTGAMAETIGPGRSRHTCLQM